MEQLSKSLQENLLTLLCFNSDHCSFIRNTVEENLFEFPYREVVRRVYRYIDSYNEPPRDHVGDLLEDLISDESKSRIYVDVLENIVSSENTISPKYSLDRLDWFVREQHLKSGILEAAEILQSEGEPDLEQAEAILVNRMKRRVDVFDIGSSLKSKEAVRSAFVEDDLSCFPTGIPSLDGRGLGPIRSGLHLFIAPPKAGKSTWAVNLGRQSLLQGNRVLVVTLEMRESLYMRRFIQNLCGMTKRQSSVVVPRFQTNSLGKIEDIFFREVKVKNTLFDGKADEVAEQKIDRWKDKRKNLIIKQFPTDQLTVRGLAAYLDRLEDVEGFIPDLVFVDYADLMETDNANLRVSLGGIYKSLRGLAMERDIAIATASQVNRVGAKSNRSDVTDVAEDFSKIATADCILGYNQTEIERKMGLARILVAAARNDEDKFEIVISQNYAMCQFVRDSVGLTSNYHDLLKSLASEHADLDDYT